MKGGERSRPCALGFSSEGLSLSVPVREPVVAWRPQRPRRVRRSHEARGPGKALRRLEAQSLVTVCGVASSFTQCTEPPGLIVVWARSKGAYPGGEPAPTM